MSLCPTVSVLRFYGCCHPCYFSDKGVGESIAILDSGYYLAQVIHMHFNYKQCIKNTHLYKNTNCAAWC